MMMPRTVFFILALLFATIHGQEIPSSSTPGLRKLMWKGVKGVKGRGGYDYGYGGGGGYGYGGGYYYGSKKGKYGGGYGKKGYKGRK